MAEKKWKEELKNVLPLEYIVFKNVPMKSSRHGALVDMDLSILEKMAAQRVIADLIPLRGREVRFLRKVLGLSLEKFAGELDLSAATILKWERAELQRLHLVNEIAVRSFVAEGLGIRLDFQFSELITQKFPNLIKLKAS